jgi:ribosomal protein L11 methyltransferase
MSWWRVSFEVPSELAEAAAWLLTEATAVPAEVQDGTTMERCEATDSARVVLSFDRPPPDDFPAQVTRSLAQLGLSGVPVQTRELESKDWMEGWRAFFKTVRVSPRIAVRPPWEPPDPEAVVDVQVDPGMAFGTGTHATTRGITRALDLFLADRAPLRVLDVGSGSGVLAVAAAHLGHSVVAVEIDPIAVQNAVHNVALNGVEDRVDMRVGSAADVQGTFPLILANIIAPVLIDIAPAILERATADVLLSGVLHRQVDEVLAAYAPLRLVDRLDDEEWAVLHLSR